MSARPRQHNQASEFPLTPVQIQAIINAEIPSKTQRSGELILRDRVLIKCLAYLATRCTVTAELEWSDFNLKQGTVTVIGKGNKQRTLRFGKLYPDLLSDLKILKGSTLKGYLFPSRRKDSRGRAQPISARRVEQIVSLKAEAAGIESPNPNRTGVHPHMFRHSWAQNTKEAGGSIAVIKHWLGHAKAETTIDHYGSLSQDMAERELLHLQESNGGE